MSTFPDAVNKYIDNTDNQKVFKKRLAEAVAIQSVSENTDVEERKKVEAMSEYLCGKLKSIIGVNAERVMLGPQPGTKVNYPQLVIGTLGSAANKPTVLVYGHFDVQPVRIQILFQLSIYD